MTTSFFNDLLSTISDRGRKILDLERQRKPTASDLGELAKALLSGKGEASGVALAGQMNAAFATLGKEAKTAFLTELARAYGPDRERLARAIATYREDPSDAAAMELHAAAEPRRQELIRRLNLAPGGMTALVRMRAELLDRLPDHPELKPVDSDFDHLFSSWFNRGFLVMRRIDWNTPAAVLEKIIRYEAVHAISDWNDLRRRIDPVDRRCYGFFHPALVDEPLIFVEVALTKETPAAIGPILADDGSFIAPEDASTAVFYSISNCQKGLRGVSFGSFLIKQVVEELRRDLPALERFVTLSPVPGFMRWLNEAAGDESNEILSKQDRTVLKTLETPDWVEDETRTEAARKLIMPLAAHYLLEVKSRGRPIDSVARFHLGNGARLERINWLGDISPTGIKQAAGLMVNYLYVLEDIEKNHEAFTNEGRIVASSRVRKLLQTKK